MDHSKLRMDGSDQSQITVFNAMDVRMEDARDNASHVWTVPETEALLKLYRERETEFKDPTTKKKAIWQEICQEMNRQGFAVNLMQCECKLKNLKATYRKSLDKAEKGIDPASRCPFYDELYEIFGLAPPLRSYPESAKVKKSLSRKRTLDGDDFESPATQVNIPQMQQHDKGLRELLTEGNQAKRQDVALEVIEEPTQQSLEKKNYSELVEALLVLRRSLERERLLREEERKKYDEERRKYEEERDKRAKEFHEERMAMLNSMNKLISNLGSKS